MKSFLSILIVLGTVSAMAAGTPNDSSALNGSYQLVKASTEYAQKYHCPAKMDVVVWNEGVSLRSGNVYVAQFLGTASGCNKGEADIGALRTTCISFNKDSVKTSDTQALTIVGFVRATRSISLKSNGQELIYKVTQTAIPSGMFLPDDDQFKCLYSRL